MTCFAIEGGSIKDKKGMRFGDEQVTRGMEGRQGGFRLVRSLITIGSQGPLFLVFLCMPHVAREYGEVESAVPLCSVVARHALEARVIGGKGYSDFFSSLLLSSEERWVDGGEWEGGLVCVANSMLFLISVVGVSGVRSLTWGSGLLSTGMMIFFCFPLCPRSMRRRFVRGMEFQCVLKCLQGF